jgi:transcriptional regulator with XRE-family HTH domain
MALRLRVREVAEEHGLTLGRFQRTLGLSMSTARRVWYSTSNGREQGERLKQVSLEVVEQIADYFGVAPGTLLEKVPD